jgi:TetR/AcrR family transcriptional repressor of uid operon
VGRKAGVTADETRTALVAAAAAVFAERGYEGATISDIAKRAGLSSGAIYAHYRSKAELLTEAIRMRSNREVTRMLAADPQVTMADILVVLGASLGRRTGGHPSLLIEAVSAARRDPEVAAALAAEVGGGEARMAETIRRAQAEGTVAARRAPEVIARFSLMLRLGALVVDALDLPAVDQDEWEAFMTGLVRGPRNRTRRTDQDAPGPAPTTRGVAP